MDSTGVSDNHQVINSISNATLCKFLNPLWLSTLARNAVGTELDVEATDRSRNKTFTSTARQVLSRDKCGGLVNVLSAELAMYTMIYM